MKDLTKGSPAKIIIMFTIPVMLGYILQQLYNMADGKIVSAYVSPKALAAVGATAVVSNTIIGFINGLTQGFAIPVANAFGAKDYKKLKKYVAGTFVLTFVSSVILTVLSLKFINNILTWLDTPGEIMPQAVAYVKIILAGIILTAVYNCSANLLRAVGDSKTSLYCLLVSVIVNIGLDLLFVCGFDWGIKGAAYATIIAQGLAGVLCASYMAIKYKEILPEKGDFVPEKEQYRTLISTGLSMGLMSCIVNVGTVVLQGAINKLGTNIVTAHTAARRVFDILSVMIFTFGISLTTFVSQNMGAGKYDRVKQGVRQTLAIVTAVTTVLIIVCYLFSKPVFMWLSSSDEPEIVDSAVMYAKISILFFYVLGPLFIFRYSLQGMGRKIIPIMSSVLEMLVKILSAGFLVPKLGYVGVAFTEPISWIVMTILLATAYYKYSRQMLIGGTE